MSQESNVSKVSEISYANSVSEWIQGAKRGDGRAAQQIWDRYISDLIRVANKRLGNTNKRVADEEDVVAQAFQNFFSRLESGGFSRLDDRDDLWQVLCMLTERRAIDQMRRLNRPSDHAASVGQSAVVPSGSESANLGLDFFEGPGPSAEWVTITLEEFRKRLELLDDERLVQIALAKMSGETNSEIAKRLDIGLRSVERKLALIRKIWSCDSTHE